MRPKTSTPAAVCVNRGEEFGSRATSYYLAFRRRLPAEKSEFRETCAKVAHDVTQRPSSLRYRVCVVVMRRLPTFVLIATRRRTIIADNSIANSTERMTRLFELRRALRALHVEGFRVDALYRFNYSKRTSSGTQVARCRARND